ncbi:MAG: histidinol dehydrogenase, partial [Planctomycetota bacterium]
RQELVPLERAGCYAPGGRYPLVSSVLMTGVTARVAGVKQITLASPNPSTLMLAAAHIAGATSFLAAGGAQAIGALAYGVDGLAPVDLLVGPGNAYVTAAKQLVSSEVGIDLPAGPSELVILADARAEARLVAADLIAQAEHDGQARAFLVTPSASLIEGVERELERQLDSLPNREVAREALASSGSVQVAGLGEGCEVCNELAPEHLEVQVANSAAVLPALRHYGALFVGSAAAEVLGDYGIGPNHVLPTGGGARRSGGLSVFDFLRVRTVLECDAVDPQIVEDTIALARLEGLEGHARAAELRES